jgi:FixJ family two-component response regulator
MGGALVVGIVSLVWGLLLQRTGRRRVEVSLDERLRFESLLSELSASLIDVSMSDLDGAIERGLQRVGTFLKVDRASLHEYVDKGAIVRISWATEGIRPLSRVLAPDQFPWATEQLRGGHIVRFSRLDELPEQASIDRQSYGRNGTQSDLSLPLRAGESLLGVLSFNSIREQRTWPDELQPRLQLLAEIFTGALEASGGAGPHRTATLRGPPVGAVRGVQRLVRSRRRSRDHSRKGLARLVKSAGYRVEVFASARDFLTRPQREDPSCLLIDVRMPGLTGLELQDALAIAGRRMSIVFVSGHGDVAGSVKAMKGGAVDFLTKPVDARELLGAIERAVAQAFSAKWEQAGAMDVQGRLKTLTAREAQVFALNKQIAAELGMVQKTVKVHRARVMEKMRAGSLAELVRLADRAGIIAKP